MIATAGQMLRIDMEGTGIDIPVGYLVQIQIKVAHCAAVEMQALRLRRKRSDMAIFQPGKVSRAERERIATESVEIGFHISTSTTTACTSAGNRNSIPSERTLIQMSF